MKLRILLIVELLLAVASLTAHIAHAQSSAYPNKPVKVVVPYPPGGPTDIVARVVFQQVSQALGQQFIVENRAGRAAISVPKPSPVRRPMAIRCWSRRPRTRSTCRCSRP